jgi:hypothetical protein
MHPSQETSCCSAKTPSRFRLLQAAPFAYRPQIAGSARFCIDGDYRRRREAPCGLCGKLPKEPGHDFSRQPRRAVKAARSAQLRHPVGTSDPLRGREAPAKPIADDGFHFRVVRAGKPLHLAGLPDPALQDADRPIVEQIATDDEFIAPVMI